MVERFTGARVISVVATRTARTGTVRFSVTVDGSQPADFHDVATLEGYLARRSGRSTSSRLIAWAGEVDRVTLGETPDVTDVPVSEVRRGDAVVVDLSAVTFMDAAALNTLIGWRSWAHDHGIDFALRNPSRAVERLLDLSRTRGLFRYAA